MFCGVASVYVYLAKDSAINSFFKVFSFLYNIFRFLYH